MSILDSVPLLAAKAQGRDNHFNLIRMIAAGGVLVSHAGPIALGQRAEEPLSSFLGITLGTVSVYVFFTISGFFIAKSFDQNSSRLRFIRARAFRLFPALAVNLCLTIVVAGLFLTSASPHVFWAEAPGYFLNNLTLAKLDYDLPGVFTDAPYGTAINGSLWTLFYEVVCYTGLFLVGLAGLLRKPMIFCVGVVALLLALFVISNLPVRREFILLAKLALPFAIGTSLYVWRTFIPLHWGIVIGLVGVAILAHGSAFFLPCFLFALCYAVFWLGFATIPPLLLYNKLGDYSYGFYIYAFPIQQIAACQGAETPLENMLYAIPATLLCAVLSWHFVERPALPFIKTAHIKPTKIQRVRPN